MSHNCKGIYKIVKSKNVDMGKKIAEIDKETVEFLKEWEKKSSAIILQLSPI